MSRKLILLVDSTDDKSAQLEIELRHDDEVVHATSGAVGKHRWMVAYVVREFG